GKHCGQQIAECRRISELPRQTWIGSSGGQEHESQMPERMQQENRQEYRSSRQFVESWKNVQSCDNPKRESTEYKVYREDVHESPRSLLYGKSLRLPGEANGR